MVRISTHADSGRLPDLVDNLSVTNLETNVRFACHTTALLMGNMGSRSLCSCYGSPPCRSPKPWIRQIYLRQTKTLRHFFGKAIPEMFYETHPIGYITLAAKRFQAHKGNLTVCGTNFRKNKTKIYKSGGGGGGGGGQQAMLIPVIVTSLLFECSDEIVPLLTAIVNHFCRPGFSLPVWKQP